jgi:hypothetical protein
MRDTALLLNNERRSRQKRSRVVVFSLVNLLSVKLCFAQSVSPMELTWNAPPNCPQLRDVEQQLRNIIGDDPSKDWQSHLRASANIDKTLKGYQLSLEIQTGNSKGQRVIESTDCRNLDKAAAVVLGLLMRQERRLGRDLSENELNGGELQPTAPPNSAIGPSTTNTTPKHKEIQPEPRHQDLSNSGKRPFQIMVLAPTATIDWTTLPSTNYGISAALGLVFERHRLFVTGEIWQSLTIKASENRQFDAEFQRYSSAIWGCRRWRLSSFEIDPCAAISLDTVSANASGNRLTSQDQRAYWMSAGGGMLGFGQFNETLSLFFASSLQIPTHRPKFIVNEYASTEEAHGIPFAMFEIKMGIGWIF